MSRDINDTFSVRNGFKPPQLLQLNELDDKTRAAIFNVIWTWKEERKKDNDQKRIKEAYKIYWANWLHKPLSEFEDSGYKNYFSSFCYTFDDIKNSIMYNQTTQSRDIKKVLPLNKIFDLIQFLIVTFSEVYTINLSNENYNIVHQLIKNLNSTFEYHKVGYRILDKTGLITPITNEEELKSIDDATTTLFQEANKHLAKAVEFYRNNIYSDVVDQSIKAVESMCKEIVGDNKATLSGAIKKMKQELPYKTHQALFESIDKLYGYASDTVRHAKTDDKSEPTESEARFVLMACSSIINYLVALNINNQYK